MSAVRNVLQNAIAELEAQKNVVYNDAKAREEARLKPILDEYTTAKRQEYNETVATLQATLQKDIASKQADILTTAEAAAIAAAASIDASIAELQKLLNLQGE